MLNAISSFLSGGSISFTANADSPTEPGKKSILTSDIEGVAADKLLEAIEKYIRDGKANTGWEESVEVADKDDGMLVTLTFKQGHKVFNLYQIDKAGMSVEINTFPGPFMFEKGVATTATMIKVHSEPVRIEAWVNTTGARLSGRFLKGLMDNLLTALGASVDTKHDAPSLSDSSKSSVVSDPIEGKPVDAESFFEMYAKHHVDTLGATELPDGSLVSESTDFMGLGVTTYAKHEFLKGEDAVHIHEYGTDSSLSDERALSVMKVHKAPFRLELWRQERACRRAGDDEVKPLEKLVKGVLEGLAA